MLFEPIDFTQLNETDIREEILAPLLRRLGYRSGTNNNIIREQSLRYPRFFLGRKKPNTDPELRGKADYICEVDRRIRWTIEAKTPAAEISLDDIEQAFTYASHPEVRAVYFCLCNGREFKIFQSNQGPEVPPILSIKYEDFNEKFFVIENLLRPTSILKNQPTQIPDLGRPIGPGLRSLVRITGGYIEYLEDSLNLPYLKGLIGTITDGAVERDENGRLIAFVNTRSPFAAMQRLNERLGISRLELLSNDETVSEDPCKPSKFSLSQRVLFPKGERIFNLATWSEIELPFNIAINTETFVQGVLMGQEFKGTFHQIMKSDFSEIPIQLISRKQILDRFGRLEINGQFEAHLA